MSIVKLLSPALLLLGAFVQDKNSDRMNRLFLFPIIINISEILQLAEITVFLGEHL